LLQGDHATYLPTPRDATKEAFPQSLILIVERLACCLMKKGRNVEKSSWRCVSFSTRSKSFISHGPNPISVVVDAIINSGPRGAPPVSVEPTVRRQAVDMSPFPTCRVRPLVGDWRPGASFRNLKPWPECLAEELINAAVDLPTRTPLRKDEIERVQVRC
jgi:small subunit ribosomal protein S5e